MTKAMARTGPPSAEELYNTAFGLIVAIPSLIFWRYFRARVDGYLLTMEIASERFVRHLNTLRK